MLTEAVLTVLVPSGARITLKVLVIPAFLPGSHPLTGKVPLWKLVSIGMCYLELVIST